jgi:hypothetical protein
MPLFWHRLIVVTGTHRCGSTWVGKMIASHPKVKYYSEPFNPEQAGGPARGYFHYVTDAEDDQYRTYLRPFLRLYSSLSDPDQGVNPISRLWKRACGTLKSCAGRWLGVRPLFKDPMALLSAEWLARTYAPDMIVLIRHPAAFASSLKRLGWFFPFQDLLGQDELMQVYLEPFRADMEQILREPPDIIAQSILLWRMLHHVILRYRLEHPDWIFIRHEDLSADPVPSFERLFQRLGLAFTSRVRQTIQDHSRPENPREATVGVVHQLHRDSAGSRWNWLRRLTGEEIRRIRRGTEEIARHFYCDADWAPSAEPRAFAA